MRGGNSPSRRGKALPDWAKREREDAMGLWLLGAGLLAVAPVAAPCSMPDALRIVCEDPGLATLEAMLVAREKQVLAVTARPATWTGRAMRLRAGLAAERDGDGKPLGKQELTARIEDAIRALDNEIAIAASFRPAASPAAILSGGCLSRWLSMNCTVPSAGVVRDGPLTIYYQVMSGASEADGIGAGVMLWEVSGGKPRLIAWTFEGVEVRTPVLNAERGLLWVPGRAIGTGEGNTDILYQKRGDRWVEIDMGHWQESLRARLPDGIDAWHGVDYYLSGDSMGAETELWRPSDANCCPTAGRANLTFVIEGDRLKLDTVSAQLAGPASPWKDF
jgi:hypothetical protein